MRITLLEDWAERDLGRALRLDSHNYRGGGMSRWGLGAALAVLLTLALAVSASAARLDAYSVKLGGAKQLRVLKEQGFDITEGQRARSIEIVGTRGQIAKLRRTDVKASRLVDRSGRGASRVAAAQASDGWQGWRADGPAAGPPL